MLTSRASFYSGFLSKRFATGASGASLAGAEVKKTALPRLWVPPSFEKQTLTANGLRMLAYQLYRIHPENTVANNPISLTAAQRTEAFAYKQMATKPWTELTLEQKATLYRMTYPLSRDDIHGYDSIRMGRLFIAVSILTATGVALYLGVSKAIGKPYPKTFSPEWLEAEKEFRKKNNIDPIF